MKSIAGKTALVTGAAAGIGKAIAQRLASEGAHVVLLDCQRTSLEAAVEDLHGAGHSAKGVPCDLADSRQIDACLRQLQRSGQGIDILVNNAGITYYGKTHAMSDENWDRVVAVNFHAAVKLTRRLLPQMLRRPEAHVVNICSLFGVVPYPRIAAYTTTKFAMIGFTEALRAEYKRLGIGVTAICPGFVRTGLFANAAVGRDRDENRLPPRWLCTTPERVAAKTVRAIHRNQRLVVMQPVARLLYHARRLFPNTLDYLYGLGAGRRTRRRIAKLESTGQMYSIPPVDPETGLTISDDALAA